MKATGIVRRVDELGRLVIPKEIRKTMRIREGDSMEIFTDNEGDVILRKYSPISELSKFAQNYADTLSKTLGMTVCITDRDTVVSAAGPEKRNLYDKRISKDLEGIIARRDNILTSRDKRNYVNITSDGQEAFQFQAISTIICEGDAYGSVIVLGSDDKQNISETELRFAKNTANLIGKHLES